MDGVCAYEAEGANGWSDTISGAAPAEAGLVGKDTVLEERGD